jgi:Ca2+-transporting ATPase
VLSAGNLFSRTIPLSPLVAPKPPAGLPEPLRPPTPAPSPAPEPTPVVPVSAAAIDAVIVVQHLAGRVRFRVDELYRNPRQKEQLEHYLLLHAGIRRVNANVLTGSVLVLFDPALPLEEIREWVYRILRGLGLTALTYTGQLQEPWHRLDPTVMLERLHSSAQFGLSEAVCSARRQEYGPNALPSPETRSSFEIFADQFKSLPVALLAGSALLALFTGGLADAVIILGVVLANASIGYYTESRAEKTISALMSGLQLTALVVREGQERAIPSEALVPGDVVMLKRGMYIPADARLLEADQLTVDESTLTGESIPVTKQTHTLSEQDVPLANRINMVYRGTVITGGSGRAVVVATGPATEVGLIQRMLAETRQPETPLQRQLRLLGGQMVIAALGICSAVFALGLLRGRGLLPMLKTAVSLAVAAVPEGLPTVATSTLALGLRRLEAQHVLVRKLAAVETLGALQIICLDKTGTITRNRMTVVAAFANQTLYRAGSGRFYIDQTVVDPAQAQSLVRMLELSALCSEVELDTPGGENTLKGTPTETALVHSALDIGVDVHDLRMRHPLLRMRLRSEQRTFMDTLHRAGDTGQLLAVKGRPAEVLSMCHWHLNDGAVQPLQEEDRVRIATENERMAGRALRVLGVAYQQADSAPEEDGDLIWVGLAGIADPPRAGMAELMAQFHQAGIHTTMITGDQSATAYAIAKEIGISRQGRMGILDSNRLDEIEPDLLRSLSHRVDVFSRVSPAHKLKIVQALQHAGYVVAMTGDGVNDGPALRSADIGIAMGKDGSEVAQEVADIIVRDDNLQTLIAAIEQGRTIYDDIRKAVHFILSSNTSEIMITFLATAAGLGEPLNPMQLLWINLVTDVFPELALSVEPPEVDVMRRMPRDPQAPMFTPGDLRRIGLEGGLITASALAAYSWGLARYGIGPHASTMAFTTLTAAQLLHAFNCRSNQHTLLDHTPIPRNPYMPLAVGGGLALQVLATLVPGLRAILGAAPLGLADWSLASVAAVTPFLLDEVIKSVQNQNG